MKSVDALRELVKRDGLILEGEELDKYLDAIEDEGMAICAGAHSDGAALAFELAKLAYKGDDERYQFCRRVEVAANDRDDVTLFGVDYTPLPVDADGVPIHVGDVMDEQLPFGGYAAPAPVDTMELSRGAGGYGWMVRLDSESGAFINPKLLRHHRAPTVEDVLREFGKRWDDPAHYAKGELVETFAEKLRLAGDE